MTDSQKNTSKTECYVGLINPKSPSNVGAILRAAGCFKADKILYSGNRYDYAKGFVTDTKKRVTQIPLIATDQILEQRHKEMRIVAFELVEGATPLSRFEHPQRALYLFGPEDGSIPQSLLNQCDEVIYVPTIGCLNLAASVNIVLYDRQAKSDCTEFGDHIIRANRDTNNRTSVIKNR